MNKRINTKSDYVDIELIVNQRGDKFIGVGFGKELEDTQRKTKDRVENPPKLNIIVPVVMGNSVERAYNIDGNTNFYPGPNNDKRMEDTNEKGPSCVFVLKRYTNGIDEKKPKSYLKEDSRDAEIKTLLEEGYRLEKVEKNQMSNLNTINLTKCQLRLNLLLKI